MPRASTRPVHPELAAEIARTGETLTRLSHRFDCHPQYLSQIIRGHARPSDTLKARIAAVLGRPVDELFAEAE